MESSNLVGTKTLQNGAGRIEKIDSIVEQICHSTIFQGVKKEKIERLVQAWFDTEHWWEPSVEELLKFLEGDL